jgi:hypothetical protein
MELEGSLKWQESVRSEGALRDYAEAAEEVGNRAWVLEALHWCMRQVDGFLWGGGAVEAEVKAARAAHHRMHGERMPPPVEAAKREALRVALGGEGGSGLVPAAPGAKPLLIDVGSCWDYFRRYADRLEVTALDLCPRRRSVLQCDFLDLTIGPEGGGQVTEEISPEACGDPTKAAAADSPSPSPLSAEAAAAGSSSPAGGSSPPLRLVSLPAGCASAVVMSLVLSYVPMPRQRGEMIRRARDLLAGEGRGLLLVITPHSTDKGHNPHKALPILKEWRAAIESMGFERYRYER